MKKGEMGRGTWLFIALLSMVFLIGGAHSVRADEVIYDSWNADATYNNPPIEPLFTLDSPTYITEIVNYHWNNYRGQDASAVNGWIGIDKVLSETESVPVGRWPVTSGPGGFGSQNTFWHAYPKTMLEPGTYRVLDSDRPTWSYTVSNYYYMYYYGADWQPYKGFSQILASAPPCVAPPAGMIGWWTGDGDASDIAAGHNGQLTNGVAYGTGKVAQAFDLGTADGYVRVPNSPTLDTPNGFTIDAWINPSMDGGPQDIASKWDDPTGQWSWIFKLHNDGSRRLRIEISRGDHNALGDLEGTTVLPLNTWSHVAATFDRATGLIRLYVNGAIDAESSAQFPGVAISNSATDILIGAVNGQTTSPGEFFNGMIDEVEFFNRALTPEEMAAIYTAGSAGKCKIGDRPPVAEAGPNQTVEMTSCDGASVTLDGSGSIDMDGDALAYSWMWAGGSATGVNPTVTLPLGTTELSLTVDDGKGGTSTDMVSVTVADMTAPGLTVTVTPNVLRPVNHKYVTVVPSITVTDVCAASTTTALVSASSNEPDNGLGDGDKPNDIVINADGSVSLRAERSGKGHGRVYTLTYQATDKGGNSTTATATVTVPHDESCDRDEEHHDHKDHHKKHDGEHHSEDRERSDHK